MPKKNAISLLKDDHKKVQEMLEKLEGMGSRASRGRENLLANIERELKAHTTVEEEIFYPAYKDAVRKQEDQKLYFEALEEHHIVDVVLAEIGELESGSENFAAKIKVLKDLVSHHIKEEEREMFPRAKKAMDGSELEELGEQIEQRKEDLVGEPAMAR